MRPLGIILPAIFAAATVLVVCAGNSFAQNPDEAPGGQSRTPGSDKPKTDRDRDRPSDHSANGHGRRDSRYSSAFSNLSEEEKKRVRTALQQVWSDPEVIAAKKGLQESTDHYRETLRTALAKVDPEMQSILKKMMMDHRGPSGHGGPTPGNRDWGDPNRPGFARSVLQRIHGEIAERMKPEMREKFKTALQTANENPSVQEALKAIDSTDDAREKMERIRRLRDAYRAALLEASPELKPFVRAFVPPAGAGATPRPARPESDRRPRGETPTTPKGS